MTPVWLAAIRSGAAQNGHEKEYERRTGTVLGSILAPQLGHQTTYRGIADYPQKYLLLISEYILAAPGRSAAANDC